MKSFRKAVAGFNANNYKQYKLSLALLEKSLFVFKFLFMLEWILYK
jgi:hypothetical protein